MKICFDKIFFVCVASLFLFGCKDKFHPSADNQPVVQDVTSYWLDNEQNYNDRTTTGYLDTFVKYYSSNVMANNTNRYLGLLKSYASTVNSLEVTDSFLLRTCLECVKITPESAQNKNILDYLKFSIGNQYYFLGNNPEAKVWLFKATEAADTVNFTKNLPSCYLLLGNIAFMENQYESAIAYYLRAVDFYEKLNDRGNISTTFVNIANCYSALHSSYYFHYYTNKAIAIAVSDNNLKNALKYRLKKAYFSFTETSDSSHFVQEVNAITSAFNDMPEKNNRLSFQVMGACVQKCIIVGEIDSAYYFLEKCIEINKIANRQEYEENIGVYKEMCHFEKYNTLSNESEIARLAADMERYKIFVTAKYYYDVLSQNAKIKGNLNQALFYTEKLMSLNDSIQANNAKGKLFDLQAKYDTEQKQQQIILQQTTISLKNYFIAFLMAALCLLLLGFLFYQQKQQKFELKQQNASQLNFSQQLLQQTEEDRKRIAADLHDSVSHELISLKKSIDNNSGGLQDRVDDILEEIRSITRSLSPVLFDNVGLQITIEQMVERVQQHNNFILTADINYSNSLSRAYELQIYRILQEAVTNMVKYSQAIAGKITITEDTQNVHIEVKDNGRGFDVPKTLQNGKAFGLHNIIERSRAISGVANIKSGLGGTIITIVVKK